MITIIGLLIAAYTLPRLFQQIVRAGEARDSGSQVMAGVGFVATIALVVLLFVKDSEIANAANRASEDVQQDTAYPALPN